jgi:polyhydroxybutyrate depolymerase
VAPVLAIVVLVGTACGGENAAEPAAPSITTTSLGFTTTTPTTATSAPEETAAIGETAATLSGEQRFTIDGAEQVVFVFVPEGYDGVTPIPATIVLHGGGVTAEQTVGFSDFPAAADRHGVVYLVPQSSDAAIIVRLLDRVAEDVAVDPARVYAQGTSAGGVLAARLACVFSDRIAAIGTGAGFQLPDPMLCERPERPIAVTSFVDPDDHYFALDDVRAALTQWASWNGCASTPLSEEINEDIVLTRWNDCDDDATVELYVIDGLNHRWASTECPYTAAAYCAKRDDFDAGTVQWRFFSAHPMP